MSTTTDQILIKDLALRCILGVTDQERREKQDVLLNLILWADLRPAAASDRLEDAVDYAALKKRIITLVEQSTCRLVETLAQQIADLCLADPAIERVRIGLEKPTALRFARSVGVQITRARAAGGLPAVRRQRI
jgi:FolB domain-containing protein